jgi:hypothetical protein
MADAKMHKKVVTLNSDGTYNYKCTGCNHKKNNLKSEGTASIAHRTHIQTVLYPTSR